MAARAPALPRWGRVVMDRTLRSLADTAAARWLAVGVAFCIVYALVDASTHLLADAWRANAPWYPQPALAVTLLVVGGIGYAPAVFAAVLLAGWLTPFPGLSAWGIAISCVGAAACYCAAGWTIARWTHWSARDVDLRDLTIFTGVALGMGLAVTAVFGLAGYASGLRVGGGLLRLIRQLAIGNVVGLVVAGPLLLQLAAGAWRHSLATPNARRTALRDLLLFLAALGALLLVVFGLKPFDEFRLFYLMFLPMIVVSMRYGLAGAALALPVVQIGLIGALAVFAARATTAFEFQILMLALALTSLFLGAASSERERAAERLAQRERELREQREALNDAQRTASTAELAAAVAHDLNQPLSAIGTYARACRLLVERGAADHGEVLRILGQLSSESQRAGQYVRRMREFFRSGAMRDERIEVRQLIDSAHAHLRDRLQRESIAWSEAIPPDLPPARGDAVQLGAVLDNLFANACDALHESRGERAIRVSVERVAGAERTLLRLCVQDTGPGVPADVREQLFKPLATSKPHGMGLGLALSRSIAERLGGALWFDAGQARTTFCLDLPADE
jgi:two-component system sensor kinase FixL